MICCFLVFPHIGKHRSIGLTRISHVNVFQSPLLAPFKMFSSCHITPPFYFNHHTRNGMNPAKRMIHLMVPPPILAIDYTFA